MTTVLQVVDDDGNYQEQAVEEFLRDQQLIAAGVNYQIIAIMGPQSSGKSTLMNAVVRPHLAPPMQPCVSASLQLYVSRRSLLLERLPWCIVVIASCRLSVSCAVHAVQYQLCGDGRAVRAQPDDSWHLACTLAKGRRRC